MNSFDRWCTNRPTYTGLFSNNFDFSLCTPASLSVNIFRYTNDGSAISLHYLSVSNSRTRSILMSFCKFSIVLPNTDLFISLNKSLWKFDFACCRSLLFSLMCSFNHGVCLNHSARWTIVTCIPNCVYSLRFLQWTTYFILSLRFSTSFSHGTWSTFAFCSSISW